MIREMEESNDWKGNCSKRGGEDGRKRGEVRKSDVR